MSWIRFLMLVNRNTLWASSFLHPLLTPKQEGCKRSNLINYYVRSLFGIIANVLLSCQSSKQKMIH